MKVKIKKYQLQNGSTRYLFQVYLGVNENTGKEIRTTRRGFKTSKEAKSAFNRLKIDFEENGWNSQSEQMTFEEVFELWKPIYRTTVKDVT